MAIAGHLRNGISRCTVVDEDFGIGTNASELVPGGRKPHVLHELRVRSDGLNESSVRARHCKLQIS